MLLHKPILMALSSITESSCISLVKRYHGDGKEVKDMPAFDGTGPRGLGPMTGRGEGYCALVLPSPGTTNVPYGYAGFSGGPTPSGYTYGTPSLPVTPYPPLFGRPRLGMRFGWGFVRGRGRARGRRSASW